MAIRLIDTFRDPDSYVFIPACCYAGNRFDVLPYSYPPMFRPEDGRLDMPVTITDVPRLEKDGGGKIEVTTGDAATPCVGVWSPSAGRAMLVFTVQEIGGYNIGLAYENGQIRLTWPAKREKVYGMTKLCENTEPWEDLPAEIPCKVLDFPCPSLARFFRVFFENRKVMGMDASRPETLSPEAQAAIQLKKFNEMNWHEGLGIYMVGTDRSRFQVWQPGWVGGAMSGYALMKLGGALETERELSTLRFLFSTQCESGFFHGVADNEGKLFGDGFKIEGGENRHLLRKSADVLYFLFKHFDLMKEKGIPIPEEFIEGARRTADGFVRLWKRYGQFGQFVDVHTGEIQVGGSTGPASACAGLAKASVFFGEPEYLSIAEEAAQSYYDRFLSKGYTVGGPGEILQCPDSESAFGLLESFTVLYEVTNEPGWLGYAKECADFCSSWVVSCNYRFPEKSEFGRHGMKSVGTVFANVQNKHSAPGICTFSGDSLLKLARRTGDPLYRELIEDISRAIPQFMSTDEDPIYDWDTDPALRDGDPAQIESHRLPAGFINERVNLSDWEGPRCVGGVFNGSCWAETSNLLTLCEVVPFLEN